jgi:hypothetical protein
VKRKGRKRTQANQAGYAIDGQHSYFRLCHLCLYLNEGDSEVVRCTKCSKYLISATEPDLNAEWRSLAADEEDDEELSEEEAEAQLRGTGFRKRAGLTGLSVVW